MPVPTWQFIGDDHLQSMFRYMRPPIAGRVLGDVIGSKDSTYASWNYGGSPGAVQGQSRNGIQIYVQEVRPAAVVLLLGSNPRAVGMPANFANDVRFAVSEAGRFGAQVILVGPFANDSEGARLAALRSVVSDTIDGHALANGLPRASDGIHLTQAGYQTLTERMIGEVFRVWDVRERAGVAPAEPTPSNPLPPSVPDAPPPPPAPSTDPSAPPAPEVPTVTITPVVPDEGGPAVSRVEVASVEEKSDRRSAIVTGVLVFGGILLFTGLAYAISRRSRSR